MGNRSSNSCPPPMKIHGLHGKFLKVSSDRLVATRVEGYADAMFFGSRVVARDEKIELIIQKMTKDWNGSLRFGFTSHNPIAICNHPEGIPRFMCPDLVKRGGSFIETINHIKLLVGDRIIFWVTPSGEIRLSVNDVVQRSQVTKPVTLPVWPVVDVYGNAVEVKFRSLSDNPDQFEEVTSARYYSSLSLIEFSLSANPQSIYTINNTSCIRNDLHKAYVWNNLPLPINHVWFLFINEVDNSQGRNLSIAVMNYTPIAVNNLPDTLQRFSGNPKYFENVYSRNMVGDEVAICVINNGDIMVALNGEDFELIGKVPKSELYLIVADLNCAVKGFKSLGYFPLTGDQLPQMPNVKGSCLPRDRSIQAESTPVAETNHAPFAETNHAPFVSINKSSNNISPSPIEPNPVTVDVMCNQCKKEKPNSVFVPCGHICCCQSCAVRILNSIKKCTKCNKPSTKQLRVFF